MKWYRFHTLLFIAFLIGTFCDQSQSWISNCKLEYDALQCDRIGKLDLWSLGRPSAESKWSALPEPKLIISPCLSSSTISTFSTTEHHWLRSGVRGKHCKRFKPKHIPPHPGPPSVHFLLLNITDITCKVDAWRNVSNGEDSSSQNRSHPTFLCLDHCHHLAYDGQQRQKDGVLKVSKPSTIHFF